MNRQVSSISTKDAPRELIRSKASGGGVQCFWMKKGETQIDRIAKAEGLYLWDTNGKRYIDASSGPVTCNIGHANEHVLKSLRIQSEKVSYAYPSAFESEPVTDLADMLCELTGPGLERAFFVSGGSEAIEMCLKFARHHAVATGQTTRSKIISRTPSYHGNTLGALAITGESYIEPMFSDMLRLMPKVPLPVSYRVPEGYTRESYAEHCAQALENEIVTQGADTVLAFVIEPIAGVAGGAVYAPDFYYRRIREICDKYGVLLIFDEVMSGAGRTGKFLAAHHWPDALPDIVALAKGFSAGYFPLGAMVVADRLLEPVIDSGGFHMGHTYKANPLGCAVGGAVLREVIKNELIENAATMGKYLRKKLRELMSTCSVLGDVRGMGLLNAIEIVGDQESKVMLPDAADVVPNIVTIARELGLLIYARKNAGGGLGDWLMITPPLTVTQQQIDEIVELLGQTLRTFEKQAMNQGYL